ncbi:MAG: hypothetical protein V1907_02525 [Candidatus Kerfeldbacteria bacterium]
MKKNELTSVFIVVAIILIAIGGGLYTKSRNKTTTSTSVKLKNPITLSELCNCSMLTGDETGSSIVTVSTGAKVPTIAKNADPSFSTLEGRSLSPTGKAELVVSEDYTKLYYIVFPEGTPQLRFTAPEGDAVNYVVWSPDGTLAIFGVGRVQNDMPSDTLPTAVYSLDIAKGTTAKLFTTANVSGSALPSVVPVTITNDGKRVLVASMNQTGVSFYSWDRGTTTLKAVTVPFALDTYFSPTAGASTRLLWSTEEGLHATLLKDFSDKVYPVKTWSDGPFGVPSPDGTKVVYLKANDAGNAGIPTVIDLNSGEESALTSDTVTDTSGIAASMWTPDNSWFIFTDFSSGTAIYRGLNVTEKSQKIRDIVDPLLTETNQLYAFLKK